MSHPLAHLTRWKKHAKKVQSQFPPEHTITGVFRAGVQDAADVTHGRHDTHTHRCRQNQSGGAKRDIEVTGASCATHVTVRRGGTTREKSPGFRPSAPPGVRWANFLLGRKWPRSVQNDDEQKDIDGDEVTVACDDYRLRKAAGPQIWAATSEVHSDSHSVCTMHSFRAGASKQCSKPKGFVQILKKKKSKKKGIRWLQWWDVHCHTWLRHKHWKRIEKGHNTRAETLCHLFFSWCARQQNVTLLLHYQSFSFGIIRGES